MARGVRSCALMLADQSASDVRFRKSLWRASSGSRNLSCHFPHGATPGRNTVSRGNTRRLFALAAGRRDSSGVGAHAAETAIVNPTDRSWRGIGQIQANTKMTVIASFSLAIHRPGSHGHRILPSHASRIHSVHPRSNATEEPSAAARMNNVNKR